MGDINLPTVTKQTKNERKIGKIVLNTLLKRPKPCLSKIEYITILTAQFATSDLLEMGYGAMLFLANE